MAEQNYIEIDKNDIPYEFDIELGGKNYTLGINYNATGDFFTLDLSFDGQELCKGEKIVINQVMFASLFNDKNGNVDDRYPTDLLIAFANDIDIDNCGWDQLGENCFLYVVPRGDVGV